MAYHERVFLHKPSSVAFGFWLVTLASCSLDTFGLSTTQVSGPSTEATASTTTTAGPTTSGPITSGPTTTSNSDATLTSSSTTSASATDATASSTGPVGTSTGITSGSTGMDTTMDVSNSTGGSTTTTSGSTTGGDTTMEAPCQVVQATLKPVAPNMMLVLDKSGSMVSNPSGYWDHDNNVNTPKITRWNSVYSVVDLVVTKFNDKLNFGASLFPSTSATTTYDANACKVNGNVEVPVAAKNGAAILAGIPAAMDVSLKGGTPTSAGMLAALAHLKTLPAEAPRAVLLVTDGAANCTMGAVPPPLFESYDNNVQTIVGNAFNVDKIPTYVVGIETKNMTSGVTQDGNPDNTNPYTKLNELAMQGGKPKNDPNEKFYNATNQIELGAALDLIVTDALSCVIPLAEEPAKPELTKVQVLGLDVPHIMDCAKEDGWVYTNPNGPYDAIQLCGTACADLKQSGEAAVNFFCMPN